jgi:hypothetical protein
MTKTVFDNGGYVGFKGTFGTAIPVFPSGMTMHLDAGNPLSYPGTGATWTDLSGNGNHMTLYGSPTYLPSQNGGVFQFVQPNQYATSTLNYSTSSFTIMAASRFSPSGSTKRRVITATTNNWLFGHYNGGNTESYYANGWISNTNATSDSVWRIYSGVENYAANQRSFYVNNVARFTNSTAGSAGFQTLSVNKDPFGESSDCQVGFIAVWNRLLSTTEMTAVYNIYKTRFGL